MQKSVEWQTVAETGRHIGDPATTRSGMGKIFLLCGLLKCRFFFIFFRSCSCCCLTAGVGRDEEVLLVRSFGVGLGGPRMSFFTGRCLFGK